MFIFKIISNIAFISNSFINISLIDIITNRKQLLLTTRIEKRTKM